MEFPGQGLDAVLIDLYKALLATEGRNPTATRGANHELLGVTVRIHDPRARLSRSESRGKPFSAIGELLWYLSKSDELTFIEPYVSRYRKEAEEGVIYGAYGPRLFGDNGSPSQFETVVELLRTKPGTRRAVIQIFDAADIQVVRREVPCTTSIQFHRRDPVLHMSVSMRSNDACFGLPHDVFCFTMLQEMVAAKLNLEMGSYIHHAGSMHVYEDKLQQLKDYVEEGHHHHSPMPPMPQGDAFLMVPTLLDADARLRRGEIFSAAELTNEPYWADIIRLLQVYWERDKPERISVLTRELADPLFKVYFDGRRQMTERRHRTKQRNGASE